MQTAAKVPIPRVASPEEVGVSSKKAARFLADLMASGIEAHSVIIMRHGKVAFECYREPMGPDMPHTMFSVSKSITSTAVGFAVDEGLLTLETKILDIFPEFRPRKRDENLEKLNIFHLLTMTAGKDVSFLCNKARDRWLDDFFKAKWAFEPGNFWRYISENQYILCAVIQRVTGQSVSAYLEKRLYEPLGFGRVPEWEKDGNGIEAGGWGLFLTAEELAKFTLCYLQGGKFNGKQVIPEKWAREAGKKQVENLQYEGADSTSGYGYCFWRNSCPDSYRADGLYSQFGMVFNSYDAALAFTSSEPDEQKARDCIWRHFPSVFFDENQSAPQKEEDPFKLRLPALPCLPAMPHSELEKSLDNKMIRIRKPLLVNLIGHPVSMLPLPMTMLAAHKTGNMDHIVFRFNGDECAMSWREAGAANKILCGMDGEPRKSTIRLAGQRTTASSTAAWQDPKTLDIRMRPLEHVCTRRLRFEFKGSRVKMTPRSEPSMRAIGESLSYGATYFIKNRVISKLGEIAMKNLYLVAEPTHRGRIL
ncbi:MAG TPA: serine hydrolase [Clostridiales bacterium]|nr:MAG: Esterase EstB [Firmicutes bacterium ADurb.Bin262]HOU09551.1 serine hydrolase [Clostridiales bacterium]HQH63236.1 serine hydrolase [Clostridiales bacterium]HQK72603.1 serine hydrolase [Clostridiales bacterium]